MNPSSLHFYYGDPDATKNIAIIVHGINSNATNMEMFADSLVNATEVFDAIYLFDDWPYYEMVNTRFSWSDTIDLISPKGLLKLALRIGGRKLLDLLSTPEFVVESAAHRLASEITQHHFKRVCLIGHSLGGIVSRCALETYDLRDSVSSLVTLGSPHTAWRWTHSPNLWDQRPFSDFPYLLLVGGDDLVCPIRSVGDLTENNDSKYSYVYKVIYPGLNHSSVHRQAAETYIPEIIEAFHRKRGLFGRSPYFIEDGEYEFEMYRDEFLKAPDEAYRMEEVGDWVVFGSG